MRSIANSRVRWATVIEKVLKIRNAATNRATPAKISSAVFRKPMNSPMSSRWDWTFWAPVSTSRSSGSAAFRFAARCSGVTPGVGGDRDLVELALLAGQPLRLGQGEHRDRRAAERVDVAERRDPASVYSRVAALAGDLDLVADLESLVVGGRLVDHDLVVAGRRAALDVGRAGRSGRCRALTEKPRLGAPLPPRGSPSAPMIETCGSAIEPSAACDAVGRLHPLEHAFAERRRRSRRRSRSPPWR